MHHVPRAVQRIAAALAVVLVLASHGRQVAAAPCWPPPVEARVTDPFREPACRWCPGNRGIEYGTSEGVPIAAIATGTVTFAGTVAGSNYVVVRDASGRRLTYGNLSDVRVGDGDVVVPGTRLGVTAGRFHLGLRVGDRYVDPAPFIGVERGVVRLVPVDGSAAPPGPPPRLVCGGVTSDRALVQIA